MGDNSNIEWTDATWNPIRAQIVEYVRDRTRVSVGWHCEHVSPGCQNCYAESMNKWRGTGLPFKPGHRSDVKIFLDEKALLAPLRWKNPRRIFVNSMSDTFADFVKDEWIDRMFAVMALAPQHCYQVLTKRAARMRDYFDELRASRIGDVAYEMHSRLGLMLRINRWPLPNVWLGVSAEDQQRADERIPLLLETPAAVRFVSLEPLLGPILFRPEWLRGAYTLKREFGNVTFNDEERQDSSQERFHVSHSVNLPNADGLPSIPLDASSAPSDLPTDVGQEPFHQSGRRAVDGDFAGREATVPASPLQVPFTIKDAGKVSQDCGIGWDNDGHLGKGRPATAENDTLGSEDSRYRRSSRAETGGELIQAFACDVASRDGIGVSEHDQECNTILWVIVGGESGPHARPMHPDWARSLRDQCAAADVPYFFKQWGEWRPVAPRSLNYERVGKKAAGRLLDGAEHNGMPAHG